ncbi:hypothetical protein [Streptomyces scabiei]|uniref:hypothetical protein n=1 Tax=Streptomyces scabiei TaxID=1930 RepID=UPI0029BA5165|nr:hypothetical protein [Streptomyces scabiei]MDX3126564.1 hypothetical protein [Streptomyces scabiei]MDX3203025.1 hypothetical protein [Streptomyces scabiei]MDX3223148.1 hypothetical protein [Streptomyces scabiei]
MIAVSAMADLVAAALGPTWKTDRGPWGVHSSLSASGEAESDTYTLNVDDHGLLCLAALSHPGGDLASYPEPHGSNDAFATVNKLADLIREYEAFLRAKGEDD